MDQIRKCILSNKICISIYENTDGWYVGNVIIGTLVVNKPGKTILLKSEILLRQTI